MYQKRGLKKGQLQKYTINDLPYYRHRPYRKIFLWAPKPQYIVRYFLYMVFSYTKKNTKTKHKNKTQKQNKIIIQGRPLANIRYLHLGEVVE